MQLAVASTLLKSSNDLGWSNLFVELRSHGRSEGPGTAPPHPEVALTVRGTDEGDVTCKIDGKLAHGAADYGHNLVEADRGQG